MQVKKKPCDGDLCKGSLAFIWKNVTEEGVRKKYCQNCWNLKKPTIKPTNRQYIKRTLTPINKISERKKKEDILYSILRKKFLEKHPVCQMKITGICQTVATEIQHLKGRIGDLYLDDTEFMAACHKCHSYVTDHPQFGIDHGFSKLRLTKQKHEKSRN